MRCLNHRTGAEPKRAERAGKRDCLAESISKKPCHGISPRDRKALPNVVLSFKNPLRAGYYYMKQQRGKCKIGAHRSAHGLLRKYMGGAGMRPRASHTQHRPHAISSGKMVSLAAMKEGRPSGSSRTEGKTVERSRALQKKEGAIRPRMQRPGLFWSYSNESKKEGGCPTRIKTHRVEMLKQDAKKATMIMKGPKTIAADVSIKTILGQAPVHRIAPLPERRRIPAAIAKAKDARVEANATERTALQKAPMQKPVVAGSLKIQRSKAVRHSGAISREPDLARAKAKEARAASPEKTKTKAAGILLGPKTGVPRQQRTPHVRMIPNAKKKAFVLKIAQAGASPEL